MTLAAGTLLGPYEILAPIGAGGMGEVYIARDTRLDRTVAIKVLPSNLSDNPDLKQRFEREARAVSSLNHPHICTLYDVGEQDGVDYLVMEHLEGETLADRLKKGALPLDQALRHAIEIADALDKAHRQGVVHRDLKPGNIMITKSGAKLLDFGLAKFRSDVSAETSSRLRQGYGGAEPVLSALPTEEKPLTEKGAILGTAQYMAPEQLDGKDADNRTDIFAFGAVLYEMVTGRRAFDGKSQASLISAIMLSEPPPVSTIQTMTPPALDHVVETCLAKDPDERWQSASDLMRDLSWIAESGSEVGAAVPVAATAGNRGWLAWIAMVLFAAVIAGIVAWNLKRISPSVTRFSVMFPDGTAFTRLTQKVLALSPDSSYIVFVANNQLYLRAVNQMESTPIPGTEDGENPFFSPDGQWIGFWAGGELKKVPLRGGPSQKLCGTSNPWGVTWGPDDTIFFSDTQNIYRVPTTGGEPQVAIAAGPVAGEISPQDPEILPDGDTILFVSGGYNRRIVAQSLSTNEQWVLVEGGSQPRYLPTGHLVYFQEGALLAVPFDSASLKTKGNAVPLVRDVGRIRAAARAHCSVSRSGGLVYIPSASSPFANRALVWVDRDGNATPLTEERRGYSHPRVSPDGRQVAFQIAEQFGGVAHVWIYDLETRSSSQLTFESAEPFPNPVWTPDGERLTFRDARDGSAGIFWKPADGSGDAELLLRKTEWIAPYSYSPDGVLAFYRRRLGAPTRDIWILDKNGQTEPFFESPANERMAVFSPDGKWIAYVSDDSGQDEVYVRPYPASGGARKRISTDGGLAPLWRPDGKELFYRVERKMMSVAIETTPTFTHRTPVGLFEGEYAAGNNLITYDIHPDGNRFLMVTLGDAETMSATPQINVVLNWSEEVKARVPRDR